MDRLIFAAVLAVVAVAIAVVLQRRQADPPSTASGEFGAPEQLDRADFERPEAPWLVVVFSSATCDTCADVWLKAQVLESDEVAVQQVEATADSALQRRYGIEAVPIVAIADSRGVVVTSFVGPVSSTHLWAAVAEARQPGSAPPGCGGEHS